MTNVAVMPHEKAPVAPGPSIQPIRNRIETIDLLRGFALLGIYLSIVHAYNSSFTFSEEIHVVPGLLDALVGRFESLMVSKRFIGIFSVLFGLGIAIQQQNFAARGVPFTGYFLRRMGILAILGLINTTFSFWAEILLVYAVFGTITLLISRAPRSLLIGTAAFSVLVWGSLYEVVGRPQWIEWFRWFSQEYSFDQVRDIYTQGPFWAVAKLRWIEYGSIYADNGFHLGMSFAMILSGYLIGTSRLHLRFIANHQAAEKPFAFALLYSFGFGIFALAQGRSDFLFHETPVSAVFYTAFLLTSMFAYLYALVAFSENVSRTNVLRRALVNNGRLSLTGYMGGAFLYSLVFYYPGLGLYAQMGVIEQTAIACLFYLAFTLFSWLWLQRFSRGPIEWVFRRFSYGRRLTGAPPLAHPTH